MGTHYRRSQEMGRGCGGRLMSQGRPPFPGGSAPPPDFRPALASSSSPNAACDSGGVAVWGVRGGEPRGVVSLFGTRSLKPQHMV